MQRVAVVWVVIACSCAGSNAPAPTRANTAARPTEGTLRSGPPLATPGEHMRYKLLVQGVELATYQLAISDITELAGMQAIVVQGHAKVSRLAALLANIDDRFTSWVDVVDGRSLRFQIDEYVAGSKIDIEHVLVDLAARDGDMIPVTFRLNDAQERRDAQKVSRPAVWDFNAFLLALRAWEGAPGATIAAEVFRSRYLWHVEVAIRGRETLVTELGELPALRIDGRTYKLDRKGARDPGSEQRTFTIWISDDDGRVPLAINAMTDYGALKMQIIDYYPGTGRRIGSQVGGLPTASGPAEPVESFTTGDRASRRAASSSPTDS